jgi:hypothetical protein
VIKECKALFDKGYAPKRDDYSGAGVYGDGVFVDTSQFVDSDYRSVQAPADLRLLVKRDKLVMYARFKHHGIVYARASTHLGNSLIMYYSRGLKSAPPVPGTIKYIFDHQGKVVFVVQRHLDPPSEHTDPFAPYPDFPAKVYSSALAELEIVEPDWVMSHFARWEVSQGQVVVLILSKVCFEMPCFLRFTDMCKSTSYISCYSRSVAYCHSSLPFPSRTRLISVPMSPVRTPFVLDTLTSRQTRSVCR